MSARFVRVAVLMSLAPLATVAEVHKCVDPKTGKSTYQDSPCDGSAAGVVEQRERPAATDVIKPAAPGAIRQGIAFPVDASGAGASLPPPCASGGPQAVWQRFQAALAADDTEGALACLLPTSRGRYREAFKQIGAKGVRESVQGPFHVVGSRGPNMAIGEMLRKNAQGVEVSYEITFVREPGTDAWYLRAF